MDGDISLWLTGLKRGDNQAIERVWQIYFEKLVRLCRRRLEGLPRRAVDEEDVALSAFNSFCNAAKEGRFPQLDDRESLWRILVTIASQKAFTQQKRDRAQKRGANAVRGESAFAYKETLDAPVRGIENIPSDEPSPDTVIAVSETCQRLLTILPDEFQRTVAVLKMQEFSNQEIADQLDCTTRTVERKLAAIRECWQQAEHVRSNPSG